MIALVTGATAGFGEAIARRFVQEGAKVIAAGRRSERLAKLEQELGAGNLHKLTLDVRNRQAVERAIQQLPAGLAEIDVLVNNAGLALGLEPAARALMDDWETMVATNINGLLYTVRATLPGMVERDQGHVVLIGSVSANYPYLGGNVYGFTL